MLRISKLTDYGTVVMAELARDPKQIISAADLTDRLQLQLPTVSKLLKRLARAGLVESFRGQEGGYRLAATAADISVADIIDALEGPISITECATDQHQCQQEDQCGVRGHWQLINGAVLNALQSVSLAQMSSAAYAAAGASHNVQPLVEMPLPASAISNKTTNPNASGDNVGVSQLSAGLAGE